MSNGESCFAGFCIGVFVASLLASVIQSNISDNYWQKSAVSHGAGEFVTTEKAEIQFRWKNEEKSNANP